MSREYHHRVTLLTLTIDGIFFTVMLPFKITKGIKQWRRAHNRSIVVIDSMSGLEFEKYIANLLKYQGYKRIRLTEHYDYGIDIIADKDGVRWGIQVKRYSGLVKASAVRQAVTALRKYDCNRAMVVTNSNFSRVAEELAKSNDCILVDRHRLTRWIISS